MAVKIKFTVLGAMTLPNGIILLTMKNESIPDKSIVPKKEISMFDMEGNMQAAMKAILQSQQEMLGMKQNYAYLPLTPEEFEKIKVTAGDSVTITIDGDE